MTRPEVNEGLIRVAAAGMDRGDRLHRTDNYPRPPGASQVLGLEASGTIVAVGDNAGDWREEQDVCALVAGGGYAGYCVAPAPDAARRLTALDDRQGTSGNV